MRVRLSILKIFGVLLILAGIIGLVLPVLQGVLFMLLGLYLLTIGYPETRAYFRKHLGRVPKALVLFDGCDERIRRWFKIDP